MQKKNNIRLSCVCVFAVFISVKMIGKNVEEKKKKLAKIARNDRRW